jgi:hypothetical protein
MVDLMKLNEEDVEVYKSSGFSIEFSLESWRRGFFFEI